MVEFNSIKCQLKEYRISQKYMQSWDGTDVGVGVAVDSNDLSLQYDGTAEATQ